MREISGPLPQTQQSYNRLRGTDAQSESTIMQKMIPSGEEWFEATAEAATVRDSLAVYPSYFSVVYILMERQ